MPETSVDGKKLPKSLIEAVGHEPLSFVIPKDGLSDLVDPSFTPTFTQEEEAFATGDMESYSALEGVSLDVGDVGGQRLVFKRPTRMPGITENTGGEANLYEGLSPLAKKCLKVTKCQVTSDDIKEKEVIKPSRPGKHKIFAPGREEDDKRVEPESLVKRAKGGSGVTINHVDLGNKYLQEFATFYECINEGPTSASAKAAECWQMISDQHFILTELCLTRLEIILQNIVSVSSTWDKVETHWLVEILKVLVGNIRCAKEVGENGSYSSSLNKVAHLSVGLIFTIFIISKNDNKLSLEEFVWEPINFLEFSLEYIKNDMNEANQLKEMFVSLQHSILHLPAYIGSTSFLDESLTFKVVNLLAGVIMDNEVNIGNDMQLQHCWENITDSSKRSLVSLFKKCPLQREFIVEELLSHVENMPLKRNQKGLRRAGHGIFVTDFTLTIISMFEDLNCFEAVKVLSDDSADVSDILPFVSEKYHRQSTSLDSFGTQVIDTIWNKFLQSSTKYRHVLENYLSDLVALLPYPQYAIAESLLAQSTKKLLVELTAAQHPANVETISLQILGTVGASIFDIKCATRKNEGNNIIRLVNYPECLPQFMHSYDNCVSYCLSMSSGQVRFVWHKTLGILLKGIEYTKDDEGQNQKMTELVISEFKRAQNLSGSSVMAPKLDYSDIKYDYFSYLHAFELINLYDPYLKLILSLLESEKIKIKSTAIKCLSMLASSDNTILSSPMVKSTIGKALENSPASVKDAILDLISIGSCAIDYYKQLNASFDDESILVRKHILKMNEMIYSQTQSLSVKAFVASRIMLRLEDEEDTIIEMARSILMKHWIFSVTQEQSAERQRAACNDVIKAMAGVASMNDRCSRHFEWFLNFYLLNEETLPAKTSEEVRQCLNKLTDGLVHIITEMQGSSESAEGNHLRGALLSLLAKFADCNVSFITKNHIVALYPYLMSDEKNDLQLHILHVFRSSLDKVGTLKPKFLLELETALLGRLPRMNVKEIGQAMPLLWRVATHRGDNGRISKACTSCFQLLSPYIAEVSKDPNINPDGKLQRLIYLATGFARYCRFTQSTGKPAFIKADESVYAYVAKRLLLLSGEGVPHIIRRVAIKNLTQLCASHPKLFNSRPILVLLDEEMSGSSSEIKFAILESLYDFFKAEELESIKRAGVNCSVSSNERLKKKLLKEKKIESVSDGVCSALVSRFLKPILAACCSADARSSFIAIKLLKLTLQYGYTNPSHCIPTVIGLLASTDEFMSVVAIEILRELLEKYETMVFSGIVQGFKVAVEYSESTLGTDFYKNDQFLSSLQKVIGGGKRSSKFFQSLLRLLRVNFGKVETARLEAQISSGIIFLSVNVSQVSFPTQSELIGVLKSIDTVTDHLSGRLEDQSAETEASEIPCSIKDTLLMLLCLRKLKGYLMTEYGLKIDETTAENASVIELRRRSPPSASRKVFAVEVERIFNDMRGPILVADIDKIVSESDP